MQRFTITISLEDDEAYYDRELFIARLLSETISKISAGEVSGNLKDVSGNTVGEYGIIKGGNND